VDYILAGRCGIMRCSDIKSFHRTRDTWRLHGVASQAWNSTLQVVTRGRLASSA